MAAPELRAFARKRMIDLGIGSQAELARLVGVSKNTITGWFTGTHAPASLAELRLLARALRSPVHQVLAAYFDEEFLADQRETLAEAWAAGYGEGYDDALAGRRRRDVPPAPPAAPVAGRNGTGP